MFLKTYRFLTVLLAPLFDYILARRVKQGREEEARIDECRGVAGRPRPECAALFWVHAASVGESQSALRLIHDILARYADAQVLVTTGTVTSAKLMAQKLPERAFHQYYPLDRPDWVDRFVAHWRPDFVIWMESELWPNMLRTLAARDIPAVLLNARLSERSGKRWGMVKSAARTLLQTFSMIFAQTPRDGQAFEALGARKVVVSGNIKYSALPLPCDQGDLDDLKASVKGRPVWVYASTHSGEEALAMQVHQRLQTQYPDLLTIIALRHPHRRDEVVEICQEADLAHCVRGEGKSLPGEKDHIYIVDTMGELGLFYRLAPIAMIGRSFSDDGGGGHNPIEAAQLGAAVLSGAHVRYQQEIFDEMKGRGAAKILQKPDELYDALYHLFGHEDALAALQLKGADFVAAKDGILQHVEDRLWQLTDDAFNKEGKKAE